MSFQVDIPPELGKALIEWEERLTSVWQVWNHSRLMITPLNEIGLKRCGHSAGTIFRDIDAMLTSGELVARLTRAHAETYTVLRTPVGSEMLRQFTNVLYPYLFIEMEDEKKEVLAALMDAFLDVARKSLEEKEEGTE